LRARGAATLVRHTNSLPLRRSTLPWRRRRTGRRTGGQTFGRPSKREGIDRVKRPHAHRHDPKELGDAGDLRAGVITERDVPRLHPTVDFFVLRHILQLKPETQQPRSALNPVTVAPRGLPAERSAHALEPDAAPAAAPLPWRISEKLCRTTATFAAPFVRRLDQPRGVKRPAKTRLVQTPAEQQLVDLLQLAQRERRRQQAERDGRLVQPRAHSVHGAFHNRAMTRRDRRQLLDGEPRRIVAWRRTRTGRDQRDVSDRNHGVRWMPAPVAERRDLLEHCGLRTERRAFYASRGVVD